jgi:oligoribonuclease NrnB/cAMP/cGMP phosphodiesterase (DHH superfamily)
VLVDLSLEARGILVLDHHKSAQADLAAFIGLGQPFEIPLTAVFDMNRSGARLAWDYADDDGHPPPLLVNLVEDRDLWRFALGPLTRFTHAVLASLPETFESVDQVAQTLVHNAGMIEDQGAAILRQSDKDVQRMIAVSRRAMTIAGHPVPVVNAPPWMASEIGNILAVGHAFAATYYDTASGKRSFSLRSEASGADVSEIASRFGGGGHAHAAGFAMPLGWEGDAE